MPNKAKEKFKTYGNVFDNFSVTTLQKLIDQGHFPGLASPLSIGKEANIFSGKTAKGFVAVKIYRLESCDFNRMYDYLKFDVRYPSIKRGKRNIVFAWTQREYRNTLLAREGGVSVPKPITRMNNVMVEELIGDAESGHAAMKLKQLIPADPEEFFGHVLANMKKLHDAGIVHGDLSEYNILSVDEYPVFIDFSQGISMNSPNAMELLERDVRNIAKYFSKLGANVDEKKMLGKITGKTG